MRRWHYESSASFCRTADQFGFFSNFYPAGVSHGGLIWSTTEHLYQAAKFTDEAIIEAIRQAPSVKQCKTIARSAEGIRHNWDEVKVPVMMEVVHLKIMNWHSQTIEMFEEVGDRDIVELSYKDKFWGASPNVHKQQYEGENYLGRIWNFYKNRWNQGLPLMGTVRSTGLLPCTHTIDSFFVDV